MKKYFYMAVAAIAALSSCASDDAATSNESGKKNGEGVTVFTATMEGCATSRTSYNSSTGKPEWIASTDKINIGGQEYTAQQTGTTSTFSGPTATKGADDKYHAYYPASMVSGSTLSLPSSYTYDGNFNMPMYAESTTTNLEFKNLCGVLAITVPATQMATIKSFEVSSNEQMWGDVTVAMSEGVPTVTFAERTLTEDDKKITINCGSGVAGGSTFYVPFPAHLYYPITVKISDGTTTKIMHTTKQNGVAVARNSVYAISFTENYAKLSEYEDINLLPGYFSVSASKQVKFTRSNLYWNGTAWHFEANQGGYPSAQGENYNSNHVGHFYWTKTEAASYASSYSDGTTAATDHFWLDGCSESSHTGTKTLTVDGTSDLYVLSKAEWKYLLEERTMWNSEKARYKNSKNTSETELTGAVYTNYKGLYIYPNNYNGNYDEADMDAINAAGIVFLPAAGYRYGSDLYDVDNKAAYSSSSTLNSKWMPSDYCLFFEPENVNPAYSIAREAGQSLRLVKEDTPD